MGIVSASVAAITAAAWAVANWKILLIVAAIFLVVYAFMQMGYSAGEVIGGIIGGIAFLGMVIWDLLVWVVAIVAWVVMGIWDLIVVLGQFIADILIGIGMLVVWVLQGIVQLIIWVGVTIWAILVTLYNLGYSIVMAAWGGIQWFLNKVITGFVDMGIRVMEVLYDVASFIDKVFGSNLAAGIQKGIDGLNGFKAKVETTLDYEKTFNSIGDQWKNSYSNLGDMYAGEGKYDDLNLFDNMGQTWTGGIGLMGDVSDEVAKISFYGEDGAAYKFVGDWAVGNTANPMDGWNAGMNFGEGLDSAVGKFSTMMEEFGDNGFDITGGDLDSVGSIGSDVDISDEDIQLLKDIAARDFLVALQTSAPQVNNTFGDIKETADVNKILEVIQDMVDEQLAVSLVVD